MSRPTRAADVEAGQPGDARPTRCPRVRVGTPRSVEGCRVDGVGSRCERTTTGDRRGRARRTDMAYAGYAPGHRVVERRTALEEALRAVKDVETLDVLEKLARNVARWPTEDKYRRVRMTNATIERALVTLGDGAGVKALVEMGWVREGEAMTLAAERCTTMVEVRAIDEARIALRRRQEEEMRARIRARALASDPARAALREAVEADKAERAAAGPVTTGSIVAPKGAGGMACARDIGAAGSR